MDLTYKGPCPTSIENRPFFIMIEGEKLCSTVPKFCVFDNPNDFYRCLKAQIRLKHRIS